MAALKDKAITLLGSFTGSIATGANPTLFTTPTGKITRITHVVFRDPSATAVAATSLSITNFRQTFSIAALTTANTGYLVVQATDITQFTEIAASTAVVLTTTTGAAITVTVDVFGYTTT
jgi:hypothetical protein